MTNIDRINVTVQKMSSLNNGMVTVAACQQRSHLEGPQQRRQGYSSDSWPCWIEQWSQLERTVQHPSATAGKCRSLDSHYKIHHLCQQCCYYPYYPHSYQCNYQYFNLHQLYKSTCLLSTASQWPTRKWPHWPSQWPTRKNSRYEVKYIMWWNSSFTHTHIVRQHLLSGLLQFKSASL